MNFTFTQFVLLVLTAAAVVVAVYVVRLLRELSGTVTEARRFVAHLNELQPQLDRILLEAEGQISDLRKVTQKVDGIAGHVGVVTQKVAYLAAPSFNGDGVLSGSIKYITAAVSGVRMVMQMFRKRKEERTDEEQVPEEKEA